MVKCNKGRYKLGQKKMENFDYKGMLCVGSKVKITSGMGRLDKLYGSYESVDYDNEASRLSEVIESLVHGDKTDAKYHLKIFNEMSKNKLDRLNKNMKKKVE